MRPWQSDPFLEIRKGGYTAGYSPTADDRFVGGYVYCGDWWGVRLQFLPRVDAQQVLLQWSTPGGSAFNQELQIDAPVGHVVDIVVPHRGQYLTVLLLSGTTAVTFDYLALTHTNRRERPGDLAPSNPLLASHDATVAAGGTTVVAVPWYVGPVHAFADATVVTTQAASPTVVVELRTTSYALGTPVTFAILYRNDVAGTYNTTRTLELPPAINTMHMTNLTGTGVRIRWALTPLR